MLTHSPALYGGPTVWTRTQSAETTTWTSLGSRTTRLSLVPVGTAGARSHRPRRRCQWSHSIPSKGTPLFLGTGGIRSPPLAQMRALAAILEPGKQGWCVSRCVREREASPGQEPCETAGFRSRKTLPVGKWAF
jgi:hypothetical protein